MPPPPCLSICRPAARAISQDWVTLASMTSRKSSGFWSTIFDTLLRPEATTRMSTRPKLRDRGGDDRVAVVLGARTPRHDLGLAAERLALGRDLLQLLRCRLAASTTLAPAPASTLAASAPNAPDAPVTIAVLPRTSNSESGFLRNRRTWVLLLPPRFGESGGLLTLRDRREQTPLACETEGRHFGGPRSRPAWCTTSLPAVDRSRGPRSGR